MLYVGRQGAVTYEAIGNAQIGPGTKGTLALWYHPAAELQQGMVVRVEVDANNALEIKRNQQQWVFNAISAGSSRAILHDSPDVAWRHVVATWDFSGGADAGVLRFYLDGQEVATSPQITANAPVGPPARISVGPTPENVYAMSYAVYDQLAIWDDAMSAEQVAALHARGNRRLPQEGEGNGRMLLRAGWDGQFDADVAAGSGSASLEGAADEYCRLERGSRWDGKRFSYALGIPRHDGSDDDRVPIMAVLQRTKWGGYTITNTEEYGKLVLDGSNNGHPVGASPAPWLPAPTPPMTLRVGIHVPASSAPKFLPIAVGAHSYYVGDRKRITCATGCTSSVVKSSALTEADDYWMGAELHMLTGAAANQKVNLASSSPSGQSVTVAGALSAAPVSGDVGVVATPRRIEPFQPGGDLYRLECDVGEAHDHERFTSLETATISGGWGYTCANLGRIQLYPFTLTTADVFFGKRDWNLYPSWVCTLLIERIEMDGPGVCTETGACDDSFMVVDPDTGQSVRAWRTAGLERVTQEPVQYADPATVQASFTAAGTWRDTIVNCPSWMEYDAAADRLTALLVGRDPAGVERVGYVFGTWDDEAECVRWADDPDPRNPMFTLDELRAVIAGRSRPYNELGMINGVFQVAEDEWVLVFNATLGNPDGVAACALTGAPDKYSFDPAEHFDPALNPLTPAMAGSDKVVPEGSGIGLYGNRDCEPRFVRNPWARHASERFWGYARAKTINNLGSELDYQAARPLSCQVTGDFRNLRTLPWRNQIIVPAYGWYHWPHPEWYGPHTIGMVVDDGGVTKSHVNLYASEDGVHLEKVFGAGLIPRSTPPLNASYIMPVSVPVRLGGRRLYWYRAGKEGNNFNLATIRLDGEVCYRLVAGAVAGELETAALRRSGAQWEALRLNVDPKAGAVRVAVVDATTGDPIAGYDADDCDPIAEGVSRRVTWGGASLTEVTAEKIALRFALSRPTTDDSSPELYSWMIAAPQAAERPRVKAVRVEGKVNPARVADPRPELTWEYEDAQGREQSAYQVLVASTEAKLDANEGDLWDSGVAPASAPRAKYAGAALESERTYFWKVRVRNREGVWSEEW